MLAIFASSCSPSVKIVYPFLNFLLKLAKRKRPDFIEDEEDKYLSEEIDFSNFCFKRMWMNYSKQARKYVPSNVEIGML